MSISKNQLLQREWVMISLILGFLMTLIILTIFSQIPEKSVFANKKDHSLATIQVSLRGAVKSPGKYSCMPGISLKALLKEVELTKDVDRKKIPLKKILYSSQSIEIPRKNDTARDKSKISL